jgi:hypothetical protein
MRQRGNCGLTLSHRSVLIHSSTCWCTKHGRVSDSKLESCLAVICDLVFVGVDDIDFNGHLSNSSYAKVASWACSGRFSLSSSSFACRLSTRYASRRHCRISLPSSVLVDGFRWLVCVPDIFSAGQGTSYFTCRNPL